MSRLATLAALPLLIASLHVLSAQEKAPRLDLAVTFQATHTFRADSSQTLWTSGGGLSLGASVWRGFGVAADIAGRHAGSIGSSGIPFSDIVVTFGPRYHRSVGRKASVFAQALIGEGDAFNGYYPASGAPLSSTNSLAAKAGVGFDYSLSRQWAVRAVDAGWVHTGYPNGTNNSQDYLQLGFGVVFKFAH